MCVCSSRGNKPANSPKGQPPDADGHSSVTDLANSLTGDMVMVRPTLPAYIQQTVYTNAPLWFKSTNVLQRLSTPYISCVRKVPGLVKQTTTRISAKRSCSIFFLSKRWRRGKSCSRGISCLCHHDNAPAHNALSIGRFLTHPTWLCVVCLMFAKLKGGIRENRFEDIDNMKMATTRELWRIRKIISGVHCGMAKKN